MKKIIIIVVFFATVSMFGPMAFKKADKFDVSASARAINVAGKNANYSKNISFKVKLNDGKIVEISSDDYLIGTIAGEMPVTYDDEALKAQGVAAYTFALYKKSVSDKEYDITADYKTDQCYLTDGELKERWGENYQVNRQHLEKIVKSIKGEWLAYNGAPILSVYHAVSCGKTYSCFDVWGKDLPYLKSVDSSFDKLSENYKSEVEISLDEFYEKLGITKSNDDKPKIESHKENNGRVREVVINDKKISGKEFVDLLSLKSQNFDIEISNNKVKITTYGRGHGVGMSQEGADSLAKSGSSYKEILHHYYCGCSIEK